MFFGARPFDIHSTTSVSEVRALFAAGAVYPRSSRASRGFVDLIDGVSLFSQSYITVFTKTYTGLYAHLNLICTFTRLSSYPLYYYPAMWFTFLKYSPPLVSFCLLYFLLVSSFHRYCRKSFILRFLTMHCFFQLLCVRSGGRISSVEELKKVQCLQHINLESVLEKHIKPSFTPPVSWLMLYDIFICFVLSTLEASKCIWFF